MATDPKQILAKQKKEVQKALDHTMHEFDILHTGKASPAMVETVTVEVASYGATMALRDIAAITTPDSRTIAVEPWDKGTLKDIEKAIQKANLGINPSVDGGIVRLSVPELSGERRNELVKIARQMGEEGKIGVRQARRNAMDDLKTAQKEGAISEDDLKRNEKEVQKITDDAVLRIDQAFAHKEKELLQI